MNEHYRDMDKRALKKLIRLLTEAAELADKHEVTLGNGGEVGSLVGGIASELELRLTP